MDYKFLHFVVFYFDFDFTFCRFYLHFICVCAFIWGFLIIFFFIYMIYMVEISEKYFINFMISHGFFILRISLWIIKLS